MAATDSGQHRPAQRVDEKTLPEEERRPAAAAFDRLVDVNLRLTEQVRNLVWSLWAFMALQAILRVVEFRLTGN